MIDMFWRLFHRGSLLIGLICAAAVMPAHARAVDFDEWLSALKNEAREMGISQKTLNDALSRVRPIERVIELDRNQPEFKKDLRDYLDLMVSDLRVARGRRMLVKHYELLDNIRRQYGVQPRFLVAIWGLETNFGQNLGGFPVIGALATLAHDERRSAFFREQLFHALQILDEGHIEVPEMQGSWAGAMGQLQFMPSTFSRFAVDGDDDGRKDIWQNLPDVFASAANFLGSYNWRGDMIWGREVRLPAEFDPGLSGLGIKKPLSEWQELGIRRTDGRDLPVFNTEASLILPSGKNGRAFLVYQNYRAIMKWNHSHLYSLAVCYLADRLAGISY